LLAPKASQASEVGKMSARAKTTRMRLAQTQVCPALRYFEAIAPLPPQGQALDRHLDIGIVENDERRIAAQFQ
jgi:hypothetical protein